MTASIPNYPEGVVIKESKFLAQGGKKGALVLYSSQQTGSIANNALSKEGGVQIDNSDNVPWWQRCKTLTSEVTASAVSGALFAYVSYEIGALCELPEIEKWSATACFLGLGIASGGLFKKGISKGVGYVDFSVMKIYRTSADLFRKSFADPERKSDDALFPFPKCDPTDLQQALDILGIPFEQRYDHILIQEKYNSCVTVINERILHVPEWAEKCLEKMRQNCDVAFQTLINIRRKGE